MITWSKMPFTRPFVRIHLGALRHRSKAPVLLHHLHSWAGEAISISPSSWLTGSGLTFFNPLGAWTVKPLLTNEVGFLDFGDEYLLLDSDRWCFWASKFLPSIDGRLMRLKTPWKQQPGKNNVWEMKWASSTIHQKSSLMVPSQNESKNKTKPTDETHLQAAWSMRCSDDSKAEASLEPPDKRPKSYPYGQKRPETLRPRNLQTKSLGALGAGLRGYVNLVKKRFRFCFCFGFGIGFDSDFDLRLFGLASVLVWDSIDEHQQWKVLLIHAQNCKSDYIVTSPFW